MLVVDGDAGPEQGRAPGGVPAAHPPLPAEEGPADSRGLGPIGVLPVEPLWPCPPRPPMAQPPPGPAHVLGSVLAGLLGGQLSDQQGLQELAHKAEVLVEGTEGILRESRQSGGQTDRQTGRGAAPGGCRRAGGRLTGGHSRQDRRADSAGRSVAAGLAARVSLAQELPGPPGPGALPARPSCFAARGPSPHLLGAYVSGFARRSP